MPLSIRSGELNDLPAILQIEQQSPLAAHWTFDQYKRLLDGGVVLVAEASANLRGFVCAKSVADQWEIENMAVDPRFQRQGIADKLLDAFIQQALSATTPAILLEVRDSNYPARRLYEKHGFRDQSRRRNYYHHPTEDAILYALGFNDLV
jgi:ribosomal-protein-alanine N-acetyltransferase